MNISVTSGWFIHALLVVTVATLAIAVGWRRTWQWRLGVLAIAVVSALATSGLRWWVSTRHLVDPPLPAGTWLWPALVLFAVGIGVAGFPAGRKRHRIAAPIGVVLTLVLAAASYNAYFAYYPTVGSLLGHAGGHSISLKEFQRVRLAPVATKSALPTRGSVLTVEIPGPVSGFNARAASVYLPPAWWGPDRSRLPVVLLLAGIPGSTADWLRAGLADRAADEFASSHGGMAPILVMADANGSFRGDTECVDGPRGRADTYLTVDVRAFVVSHFGVGSQGRSWAVAGDSAGGMCAMVLALRHPTLFRVFGDFGGNAGPEIGSERVTLRDLYGGSHARAAAFNPRHLLATHHYRQHRLAGWFSVGRADGGLVPINYELSRRARAAGIATKFVTVPGGHTFWVWRTSFAQWLPWAWQQLEMP